MPARRPAFVGWMSCEDGERAEAFLTEIINYLATKIRPISVLTGGPATWDNMLQTRGHGFDDRILEVNARIAGEVPGDAAYAEAFELEFFGV